MILGVRGRRVLRALLALPLLAIPASVRASSFALESQGARAMGFSGAYVAQVADPSAIYYNAAGIGFLKGKNIYVGALIGGLSTDFTVATELQILAFHEQRRTDEPAFGPLNPSIGPDSLGEAINA